MDRTLKARVLTAADLMTAHGRLTEDLARLTENENDEKHIAFIGGQLVGAEKLLRVLMDMLIESEADDESGE